MTGNELLQVAIDKLSLAAEGKNVLLSCADGLHALINAASIGSIDPTLRADAQRLLFAAAPQVAAETAEAAATSAVHASGSLEGAQLAREQAIAAAIGAQTARDFAAQWSSAPEGQDVYDGVNPVNKSAYHWAQVALGAATGALPDGSVTETKIADGAVTREKLAAAVTDELDDLAEDIGTKADGAATTAALATKASLNEAETLTNKTLTAPALNTPTLILKQSTSPAPTAEGDIQWDTDDEAIVVGTPTMRLSLSGQGRGRSGFVRASGKP